MSRKTLADELTKIYKEAADRYMLQLQTDRRAILEGLPAGATVPASRGITDTYLAQRAAEELEASRERALALIEAEYKRVEDELVKAPTTEEANYIVAINNRNDLSEKEIQAALNRYKSHAVQHAIVAAANRSGKTTYVSTETEQELKDLEELYEVTNRAFTPLRIETDSTHAATLATLEAIALGENPLVSLVKS